VVASVDDLAVIAIVSAPTGDWGSITQSAIRANVFALITNENTDWHAALVSYQEGVTAIRGPRPPKPATPPTDKRPRQYLAAVHCRAADVE
jgi:hypothetical protein